MKKILAGIAVLAVAAAAQADNLLASWSFNAGDIANDGKATPNTEAANIDKVSFGDLTRVDVTKNGGSGNLFTGIGWATAGSGLQFTVTVDPDWEIAGANIACGGVNAANSGPAKLDWSVITGQASENKGSWSFSYNKNSAVAVDPVQLGDIGEGAHTVKLSYVSGGQVTNPDAAPGGSGTARIAGNLEFNGTIREATSIPEPATMSLLGLGALALALRRKLRK